MQSFIVNENAPPADIFGRIFSDLDEFAAGCRQADDQTLVIVGLR
jgi:serine phosphatase RsbU (regulator of sigma subunit)